MNEWISGTGQRLLNIHDPSHCEGRGCPIHHHSGHRMGNWTTNWRADLGVMERLCDHGVGHPDPDDAANRKRVTGFSVDYHGCDGCCGN